MQNRTVLWVYRLLAFGCCLFGLCLNFGFADNQIDFSSIVYFTLQSNLLCLLVWLLQLAGVKLCSGIRGCVAMCILLTMTVYHFLLSGTGFVMQPGQVNVKGLGNLFVHYITPVLMILDFLFLGKRRPIGKWAPVLWSTLPLAYLAFALIRAASGTMLPGRDTAYPYFFIDPAAGMLLGQPQGFLGVTLNVLCIIVIYVGVGYLLRFLYNLLTRLLNKDQAAPTA